ncbi:unnamed protein product [Dicrocoelium dendriticum]|nr:unnamed protein product [Dicrocoelium dendriticum]
MEKGSGKFHTMDIMQGLHSPKDCMYSSTPCFSVRPDTLPISQNMSSRPDLKLDPSTIRIPLGCTSTESFDSTRSYFRSSPDTLPVPNYHCTGTYSEFIPNTRSENSLISVVRTRRRKAGISDEERICIVCGEPASGYNFDRLTCESCKAFFRRNALKPKDKIKACSRGGGCIIEGNQRKHCPSCRLEKCFLVGMKRELILPPEKLEQRAKPRRRKQNSPQANSCSPQHMLTAPSSVGSATSVHLPYVPSPAPATTHPPPLPLGSSNSSAGPSTSLGLPTYTSSPYTDPTLLSCAPIPVPMPRMDPVGPNGVVYQGRLGQASGNITTKPFCANPTTTSKSSPASHTTNIYGLIVLYSSFFFERDIRKLRYPVLRADGQLTTVTVSMLDEVVTPSSTSTCSLADESHFDLSEFKLGCNFSATASLNRADHTHTTELREEFELYKANTLAAFDHLDQLIGSDDILRVSVLAIKLFSDDSLLTDELLQSSVGTARQSYLFFLWTYLRWRAGPRHLRSATELYARLLIAFIDLRTLEIRMTEFAKVLSLDGLSPLMREVCSQRTVVGSSRA